MRQNCRCSLLFTILFVFSSAVKADSNDVLESLNIFDIEYASGLAISADGKTAYFVRNYMDIQTDRKLGNIWKIDVKTKKMLPVTTGDHIDFNPKLSPDGSQLAFISTRTGKPQIYVTWLSSGHVAKLTNLTSSPNGLSWSPDGKHLAFSMFVEKASSAPVTLKGKPKDAKWAENATFIDDVYYRFDGAGYAKKGSNEIFVISSQGGTARQLTDDEYNNGGALSWGKDSKVVYFSAIRSENQHFTPLNNDVYGLDIMQGTITQLTERNGPDNRPAVSPDGKSIAYLGFDDKFTNYENAQLYVMDIDGKNSRQVTQDLDRSISRIAWDKRGNNVYIQYDDQGKTILALQSVKNGKKRELLTDKIGGQSYGRPYTSGEFAASPQGNVVITTSDTQRPADVGLLDDDEVINLTSLNEDALAHKTLARVEEVWYKSSADGKDIQGWIAYPPNFDKSKKYPLVLEIHGGPVTAYGPQFSMEIQLFAAAGNVVLYTNPRGSSSYGKAFANTIDKNYPSQDYDDLISGVDEVINMGFIDPNKLFVTGGSGGGVLTAWIVGKTDRFKAAVVAKPVINWFSFVLTADFYPYFYQYWFNSKPWEDIEGYMKFSPISLVGNVTTPTMLLTGESDYRTPISETEQYYQALKIQGVETAMVRIPGASHGIYRKPSNLMAKVEYILWWFNKHDSKSTTTQED